MVNNNSKVVLKELKKVESFHGLTITELTAKTKMSRDTIRVTLAYLMGAKMINEIKIGMAKLYTVSGK